MKWTDKLPDAPGFYWCKMDGLQSIVLCKKVNTGIIVEFYSGEGAPVEEMGDKTQWAGPIPEPEE